MTIEERRALLERSVREYPLDPGARRYTFRRAPDLEWFVAVLTEYRDGEPVFHGYPTRHVPARVLREFRAVGDITEAEYRRAVRELV